MLWGPKHAATSGRTKIRPVIRRRDGTAGYACVPAELINALEAAGDGVDGPEDES
jgi:hypothetical protein